MNDLPNWASSTIAVAVGLMPGLALLSARPIARLIYRVLSPRPVEAPQSRLEPALGDPAGVAVPRGATQRPTRVADHAAAGTSIAQRRSQAITHFGNPARARGGTRRATAAG